MILISFSLLTPCQIPGCCCSVRGQAWCKSEAETGAPAEATAAEAGGEELEMGMERGAGTAPAPGIAPGDLLQTQPRGVLAGDAATSWSVCTCLLALSSGGKCPQGGTRGQILTGTCGHRGRRQPRAADDDAGAGEKGISWYWKEQFQLLGAELLPWSCPRCCFFPRLPKDTRFVWS